jgi:hypothetical protein
MLELISNNILVWILLQKNLKIYTSWDGGFILRKQLTTIYVRWEIENNVRGDEYWTMCDCGCSIEFNIMLSFVVLKNNAS